MRTATVQTVSQRHAGDDGSEDQRIRVIEDGWRSDRGKFSAAHCEKFRSE
jgi:hypothetical protein